MNAYIGIILRILNVVSAQNKNVADGRNDSSQVKVKRMQKETVEVKYDGWILFVDNWKSYNHL